MVWRTVDSDGDEEMNCDTINIERDKKKGVKTERKYETEGVGDKFTP